MYGWVVTDVTSSGNKQHFVIRNIFTDREKTVNKAKICKFHRPLWKDPKWGMDATMARVNQKDAERLRKKEEMENKEATH